jgi:hypothetical protein
MNWYSEGFNHGRDPWVFFGVEDTPLSQMNTATRAACERFMEGYEDRDQQRAARGNLGAYISADCCGMQTDAAW